MCSVWLGIIIIHHCMFTCLLVRVACSCLIEIRGKKNKKNMHQWGKYCRGAAEVVTSVPLLHSSLVQRQISAICTQLACVSPGNLREQPSRRQQHHCRRRHRTLCSSLSPSPWQPKEPRSGGRGTSEEGPGCLSASWPVARCSPPPLLLLAAGRTLPGVREAGHGGEGWQGKRPGPARLREEDL